MTINFWHNCNTDPGSSGGPIILINNFSIIGLHKGYDKENNKNVGIFLREIINNINENNILKINKKIDLNNESEKENKKDNLFIIKQIENEALQEYPYTFEKFRSNNFKCFKCKSNRGYAWYTLLITIFIQNLI